MNAHNFKTPEMSTRRVTNIAKGSRADADMIISIDKTETMHICDQGEPQKVSQAEAAKEAEYKCPHAGCGFKFHNKHGVKVHAGRCTHKDTFYLDKILEVQGECGSPKRRFLVSWQGHDDQTWEPYANLPPDAIKEFLIANGHYNYSWEGARCEECDKPCKNLRGVKNHRRFCY